MQSEISDNLEKDEYIDLSKAELRNELKIAKSETYKYVNKFLEVEEKWAFTNILLKKLNSIRQKKELCKTVSEGFLKLTNSQVCYFALFHQDSPGIEFKHITHSDFEEDNVNSIIESVNTRCAKFLKTAYVSDAIEEYFKQISGKDIIATPIIYSDIFQGFLFLKNKSSTFYDDNINFINIFPEHIALVLENIAFYQESEKQNKRKVEFLAGIAHEFKTPLNSIIGFSEVLNSTNCSEQNGKYIRNILKSSKHLLSLIEDIIDVSKSQYKVLELNYSQFSPREEIMQILSALEQMINEKKLTLNYTLVDVKISADVKRFRQLIYNLVSNAIKFNKIKGEVFIITYIKDGNFFFEITDTGDGISKKNYDKIFEFFSQVNRNQLKRQLGSGVGLALCKKIIDAHQGEIAFSSEIKKGSCFWFSIPKDNNK